MSDSIDDPRNKRPVALYAVGTLGSAALGALLSVIVLKVTGSVALANTTLGIAVALGIFPILNHRALQQGIRLQFWKYATAWVVLAFAANFVVQSLR